MRSFYMIVRGSTVIAAWYRHKENLLPSIRNDDSRRACIPSSMHRE